MNLEPNPKTMTDENFDVPDLTMRKQETPELKADVTFTTPLPMHQLLQTIKAEFLKRRARRSVLTYDKDLGKCVRPQLTTSYEQS